MKGGHWEEMKRESVVVLTQPIAGDILRDTGERTMKKQ